MTGARVIKITRKLREQAARVCEVEASTPELCGSSDLTAEALGYPADAGELAIAVAVPLYYLGSDAVSPPEPYAEAALRIREGFTPSSDEWTEWRDS